MQLLRSATAVAFVLLAATSFSAAAQTTRAQETSAPRPQPSALAETPLPDGAALPKRPPPTAPDLAQGGPFSVRAKDLELVHSWNAFGAFVIRVAGKPAAIGQNRPMIGYMAGGELRWLDLANAGQKKVSVRGGRSAIKVQFDCADADGARWHFDQQFRPGSISGAIDIQTEVTVDRDRAVAFLPMLTVFPGAGTFGTVKGQGLFAGLEYLENEPSSSEADVIGPAAKRQVPDNLKITFPLMVIQHESRYVALTWEPQPDFSALFDSPDRVFGSGGHVMGLLFPGSNGKNRPDGSLLPRVSQTLRANQPLVLHATLLGGQGESVVPAIQQYVSLRGLPPLPGGKIELAQYVSLAAGGWLDSTIREGNLIHHAVADGSFPAGQAADAAVWMDWLAGCTDQPDVATRLRQVAREVLGAVPPENLNAAGVGHVRYPVAPLVYGHVAENAERAAQKGRHWLESFEPDGSIKYHPRPGGPDFAKTHSSCEANGLTARTVMDLLEAAAFTGDRELLEAALKRLRGLDKFRDGVPRGAQTWECPLHTPDILAAAHLVRAYTLGYELTGAPDLLERARYWAWTGVPFVYLVNPAAQPVGLYGTIAVFGATQWRAPVWLGLPVQWCGLVYAEALYRLVRDDPQGPWKILADGITLSGLQQTWPLSDAQLQGLLPDSFVLRAQHRNGPAINPATLQACAVRCFNQTPVYDFWSFRENGLRVHAPGEIKNAAEETGRVAFQINTWVDHPYFVLINGLTKRPRLAINGKEADCTPPHQFLEKQGRLVLQLEGKPHVVLAF